MHMILTDHTFHDPNLKNLAGLPHQLPDSLGYSTRQHFVAVLRDPYKVVLNLKNRMAAVLPVFQRLLHPEAHYPS